MAVIHCKARSGFGTPGAIRRSAVSESRFWKRDGNFLSVFVERYKILQEVFGKRFFLG